MPHVAFVSDPRRRPRLRHDLEAVAERVNRRGAGVRATLLSGGHGLREWLRRARLASARTLIVDMHPKPEPFWTPRGRHLQHWPNDKIRELRALERAGLPVPRWTEIRPDTALDPEKWGAYVVIKPSRGQRGAWVWVKKTGRVRYKPPEAFPEGHFGRVAPMIAQEFVYTGRWPVSYRVLTFLGRRLTAIRFDGRREKIPPQEARYDFHANAIVANAKGSAIRLAYDADVIELAERVHAVLPDVPSLGVDLVRDVETGRLYVIETNPMGRSWMLSFGRGKQMQVEFGLDFYSQFGALDTAADAAIAAARRWAC